MSVESNDDPLFQYQWFLINTGQSGGGTGQDINVKSVWKDYTGKGVNVAIVDDGVQLNHPDLLAKIDAAKSWDAVTNKAGGNPASSADNHGTSVAGLVAEVANNGIGGKGVAYGATLQAYRSNLEILTATTAYRKAFEFEAAIVNNSWGDDRAFGVDRQSVDSTTKNFFLALDKLVEEGRDEKGSIVLFANGNRGGNQYNYESSKFASYEGNLDNVVNDRHVIAVGAIDNNGVRSSYTTPGANLLISAPGGAPIQQLSDLAGTGTLTTTTNSNYEYNFNGTSAATPIVSGVVALMLEANPNLGYRDVQEILAHSARFNVSDVLRPRRGRGFWS